MQKQYGIIGYPLSHSFSPAFFTNKFREEGIDATYTAYPITTISELPLLLQAHSNLAGLNVTIPYKQQVQPFLDTIADDALQVGAVNCITISNGKLAGYNTDIVGFRNSLQPLLQPQHTSALILGTGGAAAAVAYVLEQLGISFRYVSRRRSDTYAYADITADIISTHKLIINTTPLGMYPDVDSCPDIPYHTLTDQHLLYDLIYNPEETKFLRLGRRYGAATKNGYEMLVLQAEASWEIWNR